MNKELQTQFDELHYQLQEIRLKMDQLMIKSEQNLGICYSIINMLEGTEYDDKATTESSDKV
jgi:hypothetical protein